MKYSERKEFMERLDPDNLKGGKSPADVANGHFRYYLLTLLADIGDNVGSLAYAYQEMLKIQQSKSQPAPARTDTRSNVNPTHRMEGIPPTEQSRYGGPK